MWIVPSDETPSNALAELRAAVNEMRNAHGSMKDAVQVLRDKNDRIEALERLIRGNGEPGLRERILVLEEKERARQHNDDHDDGEMWGAIKQWGLTIGALAGALALAIQALTATTP